MSVLRRCPVRGSTTLLAPERLRSPAPPAPLRPGPCPLCPEGQAARGRVLGRRGRAFACAVGRPALRIEASSEGYSPGLVAEREGLGAHEVVVADPRHGLAPSELDPAGWRDALLLARERMRDLRQDIRLRSLTWFAPWRVEAGGAVDHLHLQILALPDPQDTPAMAPHLCPLCAMLASEDGRLVLAGEAATSLCPSAPQADFEVWVLPRAHQGAFEGASDPAIAAVAEQLPRVLGALDRALQAPALGVALRASPPGREGHWRIEISPKLAPQSAISWATGLHVCTVSPEDVAAHLRELLADGAAPR